MAKHKVLSTKRLDPSLLEQAKENGIEIIEQEAIRVNPILSTEKWDEIFQLLQTDRQFAIFTSSNAVVALRKYLDEYINPLNIKLNIYTLSGKTRQALEENLESFGAIVATADDSKALADNIVQAGLGEVIFFCGNKRRDELPRVLKAAGIKVHEVIVYKTEETPIICNEDYEAVIFFSPSAVNSFFSVNQLNNHTVCFAIGQTTADSIASASQGKIVVAKTPAQEALLEEVIDYFKRMVKQD